MLINYVPYNWANRGPEDEILGNPTTKSVRPLFWNSSALPFLGTALARMSMTFNYGMDDNRRIVGSVKGSKFTMAFSNGTPDNLRIVGSPSKVANGMLMRFGGKQST